MPEIEHAHPGNSLFSKYELGRLLGRGAFAKVYHARHLRSGRSVAVKVIDKKRLSSTSLVSNIKREISIMSRLNHPYIVRSHEVLATKSKIYFVMDFVKGGELFSKVSKGRFSEDLSRRYFQQLICAVGYCHARGVFHRDLKPENLLLDENGNLKVTDFGLSAVADQIQPDGMLHTLCGTPAYVAPEILRKKGYDGAKVDVWSCGIILYVIAAGYLPFNDPNLMALYKKIYKGEFRCPKWMSNDLKRLLHRLLDTNPETRITVDEILKDPWFRKGYKEPKFSDEYLLDKDEPKATNLNAFDLISFSSGLNLSGLFDGSSGSAGDIDRFVLRGPPEKVVKRIEQIAKSERLGLRRRKEWGLELEWQNGKLVTGVDVHPLTDELVVVEAKRRSGDGDCYRELWSEKVKPGLMST